MLDQLLLGSAITLVSLVGGALLWWLFNELLEKKRVDCDPFATF